MSLRSLSDAALASRAAAGDDVTFSELARRNGWLLRRTTRQVAFGMTLEDQRQEALIGLFEACRAFDPAKGSFAAIATTCVRRAVWNARLKACAGKQRILTEALGLDHRDRDELTIAERVPARDADDPALVLELREKLRELAATGERRIERRAPARPRRRYTDTEISVALSLVAEGKTLREAGAAVGAAHGTVLRWLHNAA
jgi:hypothetical protein